MIQVILGGMIFTDGQREYKVDHQDKKYCWILSWPLIPGEKPIPLPVEMVRKYNAVSKGRAA